MFDRMVQAKSDEEQTITTQDCGLLEEGEEMKVSNSLSEISKVKKKKSGKANPKKTR